MKNFKNAIVHRGTYKRVPRIDGSLGLCPNSKESYIAQQIDKQ